MVLDYDFALGKSHLRGVGWRGLAALGMLLVMRATVIALIAVSAKSSGPLLLQALQHLWGS